MSFTQSGVVLTVRIEFEANEMAMTCQESDVTFLSTSTHALPVGEIVPCCRDSDWFDPTN